MFGVRSMKLIYILNSYSKSDSSHFAHITHLLDVMAGMGCCIDLVIEKANGLPEFQSSNVNVYVLSSRRPIVRHIELFVMLIRLIRAGGMATFVRISAVSSIVASLAHKLFGGKSYLWQSGTTHEVDWAQPRSMKKFRWWLASYIPNWTARKLTTHFVTGPEAMVDYYANVVGVNRKKICLLYNDIDISRFSPASRDERRVKFLAERGFSQSALVLLLVHRLSPVRRSNFYLKPLFERLGALGQDNNWVFIVAGGGGDLPEAMALAKQNGLDRNVIFLGDYPNNEISGLYGISDIFVHPTYTEGFPRVVIEAMAAGLPIVTTDAGGTEELLGRQQRKFVSDKKDPDAFVSKLMELIDDKDARSELAAENKVSVEKFSTPNVSRMYIRTIFGE